MLETDRPAIDPQAYRQVLGQYPTGVCVITGVQGNGEPVAMVVGSFTAVSLSPPLVGFLPDKGSSSWAKLRTCRHFCVNILAMSQEHVCRKLASKDPDKFSGISHSPSAHGVPLLHDVVARIECVMDRVVDAGDHDMVFGQVSKLEIVSGGLPLLFFQGGYGAFSPRSLAMAQGVTPTQLRQIDRVRGSMERLAGRLSGRCIATQRIGDDLVVAASAGQGTGRSAPSLVGQRLPFAPPTGSVFAAWMPPEQAERWLRRGDVNRLDERLTALQTVRQRGYSVGLLNDAHRAFAGEIDRLAEMSFEEYSADLEVHLAGLQFDPALLDDAACRAIRVISAPVFDATGQVVAALSVFDFAKPQGEAGISAYIADVLAEASTAGDKPAAERERLGTTSKGDGG